MQFYEVHINPGYQGTWWRSGKALWDAYAVDPDDQNFCVSQVSLMRFLVEAQRIGDWYGTAGTPVVWNESATTLRRRRRKKKP